jgi:hypothetical protein
MRAQTLLECSEIKNHAPGEMLSGGDAATFVLLVLTGHLQVFVIREGRDLVLSELGGTILGELAVLRHTAFRVRAWLGQSVVLCWRPGLRRLLLSVGSSRNEFRETCGR